jgi:hypothetical protein
LANGDGTGGNHSRRGIDGQFKEVKPRTGVGNKAAWGANGEPDACNDKKKRRCRNRDDVTIRLSGISQD